MASVTRQRNPRGEGARLRERLVDAAVEVVSEVGDASKVSVRAITRQAGVSPTAMYLHFPDRDALVDAAVDAGFAAFNEAVLYAGAAEAQPREQLRAMGLAYLGFAQQQPQLYAVIFGTRRAPSESAAVDRGAGFMGLVDRVTAALGSEDRAREVAVAMWTSLHGYATLGDLAPGKEFPPPERFVAMLLDAYL